MLSANDGALITAIQNNNIEDAKASLEKGANPNIKTYGIPLIIQVVNQGNVAMLELLLKHNAKVNAKDQMGYTPLLTALYFPEFALKIKMVGVLNNVLKYDANVSISHPPRTLSKTLETTTEFHIIRLLLNEQPLEALKKAINHEKFFDFILQNYTISDINQPDASTGNTVLMNVILSDTNLNKQKMAKKLLKLGTDIYRTNNNDKTALCLASEKRRELLEDYWLCKTLVTAENSQSLHVWLLQCLPNIKSKNTLVNDIILEILAFILSCSHQKASQFYATYKSTLPIKLFDINKNKIEKDTKLSEVEKKLALAEEYQKYQKRIA